MPLPRWLGIGGLLVAGAVLGAALVPTTALQVENAGAQRSFEVALAGGRFAITYQHSMYDQPVTEEFEAEPDGTIRLLSVSSPSAAVREYFGLSGAGERHAMDRRFRELVFRIAAGPSQLLHTGSTDRSFLDFGAHGDRLVVHVLRASALHLFLDHAVPRS
jgi:hypothetical protein